MQRHMLSFAASRPLWLLACGSIFILFSFLASTRPSAPDWRSISVSQHHDNDSYADILNATLGFQKIFVINLPTRTDHKDAIQLAAHFTGLQVEFVDGVTEVASKALPPHDTDIPGPVLGAWRAHLNIAQKIVEQNITSALILEDDVDWDLRLKANMQNFARAAQLHVQPCADSPIRFLDSTNPRVSSNQHAEELYPSDALTKPTTSPYGDINRWDLFWLGHCGTRFPDGSFPKVPLGRVSYADESVPETQHIGIQVTDNKLIEQYPNHTRVVHRAAFTVCSLGYAVSLPGARRILYEAGVRKLSGAMDLTLNAMCEGLDDRRMLNCLAIQPELFQHHRAVGDKNLESDIVKHEGFNPTAYTRNIRWSARINLPKLVEGETDYIDTYPDGAGPAGFGF